MTTEPGRLAKKRKAAAHPDRPGERCAAPTGTYRPVIDHARCEGKRDCVDVCPNDVFEVRRIDDTAAGRSGTWPASRSGAHGRLSAYTPGADDCRACGLCVVSCPEQAIVLTRLR